MNKRTLFVLVLFLAVGIAAVFAVPGKTNCTYALPGTNFQMKFWVGGNINLTAGGQTYSLVGNFKVSGDRVTVTFKNKPELGNLSGTTFVLTILSNGDLNGGDGTWVKIADN